MGRKGVGAYPPFSQIIHGSLCRSSFLTFFLECDEKQCIVGMILAVHRDATSVCHWHRKGDVGPQVYAIIYQIYQTTKKSTPLSSQDCHLSWPYGELGMLGYANGPARVVLNVDVCENTDGMAAVTTAAYRLIAANIVTTDVGSGARGLMPNSNFKNDMLCSAVVVAYLRACVSPRYWWFQWSGSRSNDRDEWRDHK